MKICKIFSSRKFVLTFLALLLASLCFYLLATGSFVLSLMSFVADVDPIRLVLLVVIAVLTALALTVALYKREQPLVCSQNAAGALGGIIALFATSCPICFPLVLSWVGIGGATALAVSNSGPWIQVASIVLLSASIYYTSK